MIAIVYLRSAQEFRALKCKEIKYNYPKIIVVDSHWDDHEFPYDDVVKVELVKD